MSRFRQAHHETKVFLEVWGLKKPRPFPSRVGFLIIEFNESGVRDDAGFPVANRESSLARRMD